MQIKKTISYLLLFLIPFFSPTSYFEKIFGTAGSDYSRSVKQLQDGSIYVFGNTDSGKFGGSDLSLTKLDRDGNQLWTNYYGSANSENGFYLNTTADKNFVFIGEQVTATSTDIIIYKVDTSGNVIWNKMYATALNETATYIEQTDDGGYILSGAQNDSLGYYDLFVLKLNAMGDYQWHKTFGPAQHEFAKMIHQVKDGYILTGDVRDSLNNFNSIVYKLDKQGNEVWAKKYGGTLVSGPQGIIPTSDGNYLLYGETEVTPGSRFNGVLEKIDTSGNSIWRSTFGGDGADAVFSVAEDPDGGFVCTGYSNSYNGNKPIDLLLLKTDASGQLSWKQTYGGNGIDMGLEVIRNKENKGYIITGYTFSSTDDYYLLQVNEKGMITHTSSFQKNNPVFEIYPNPASEKVKVNYEWGDNKINGSLLLTDIRGRMLKRILLPSKKGCIEMDITNLVPGTYFCLILLDQQTISCKQLLVK